MPLNNFKCEQCGEEKRSLKEGPTHCGEPMKKVVVAPPAAQFLEPRDSEHRTRSVRKGLTKEARERSKNHARDKELHDFIQTNHPETVKNMGWLNKDGTKRKKIDDL